jgi:hypothetical protein
MRNDARPESITQPLPFCMLQLNGFMHDNKMSLIKENDGHNGHIHMDKIQTVTIRKKRYQRQDARGKTDDTNTCSLLLCCWTQRKKLRDEPTLNAFLTTDIKMECVQDNPVCAASGSRKRRTGEDKSSCSSNEAKERSNFISAENCRHLVTKFNIIGCPDRSNSLSNPERQVCV